MTLWPQPEPAPYPPLDGTEPCATGDSERFFPERGQNLLADAVKAECRGCHVLDRCWAYAITHAVEGIWGATTEGHRRTYRRLRHIRAIPVLPQHLDGAHAVRLADRGIAVEAIARSMDITPVQATRLIHDHRQRQQNMEQSA